MRFVMFLCDLINESKLAILWVAGCIIALIYAGFFGVCVYVLVSLVINMTGEMYRDWAKKHPEEEQR